MTLHWVYTIDVERVFSSTSSMYPNPNEDSLSLVFLLFQFSLYCRGGMEALEDTFFEAPRAPLWKLVEADG